MLSTIYVNHCLFFVMLHFIYPAVLVLLYQTKIFLLKGWIDLFKALIYYLYIVLTEVASYTHA